MKYIVAVSGGVDSVVLLHMLARRRKPVKDTAALQRLQGEEPSLEFISKELAEGLVPPDIIVAHFDHGIRPESDADARFVAGLAAQYGLPFEQQREELGAQASEELARTRRYVFLQSMTEKHGAVLVTAHHADDAVESIAINMTRGTGWRGLATMGNSAIYRPLLSLTKHEIYEYATSHNLEWVEDETNQTDKYLRNRIRARLIKLDESSKRKLLDLRTQQLKLRDEIDIEVARFVSGQEFSRYFFIMIARATAMELLRAMTRRLLTTPQLDAVLVAVKVGRAGTAIEAGAGVIIQLKKREFIVVIPQ